MANPPLEKDRRPVQGAARKVAVIGAGWAGCAAAVELARKGLQVSLFESARTLGGRARRVEHDGAVLDNGQHILLGAYRDTLRLMRLCGIDPAKAMLRLPLQMRYPPGSGGMDFIAPRLPAPLHLLVALLRTKGLANQDKLALARFSTTARWMDWRLHTDCSVSELLERFDQTERLSALMWRPLCIAALNTPPQRASAQVFLNVLRDSLGARRAASDMLLPTVDLSTLFPQRAAAYVGSCGGQVNVGTTVTAIRQEGQRWRLSGNHESANDVFDAVIVATQAPHAASLLEALPGAAALPSFEYEPITTCYLQYAPDLRLEQVFYALADNPDTGSWGQFVFDRGQLDAVQAGMLAVVVSASADAIALGHVALTAAITRQLVAVLGNAQLANPRWSKVITEKRATFACTPGLQRPPNATGLNGLFIAGDYTAGDYPATLESAVRSGIAAAKAISLK